MKPIYPLENLCGPGKPLSHEPPGVNEYAGLLKSGMARLADASNLTLSPATRFRAYKCVFPQ